MMPPSRPEARPYLSAAIVLCPGFTLTPMSCFSDVLRLAADQGDNSRKVLFQWEYAVAGEGGAVSSSGLEVRPTIALDEIMGFDCIVVCGGLLRDMGQIRPDLYDLLRQAHEGGALVVGLCTGSFVLGEAGLLEGKSCAVHPNVLHAFSERFPGTTPLTRKTYWEEGRVITCPGGVLSLDVAAHLIRTWGNMSRTFKALDYLLFNYENPRTYFPKRPYQERLERAATLTRDAVGLMEANIETPLSVTSLARRLATTRTRLTRVFQRDMGENPAAFWLNMRLDIASRLLVERSLSVTEIGYELGFSDTAHFCRQFRRRFDRTPGQFRKLHQDRRDGAR
ncbi:helix-turn-helix domain-containing protein [Roseovarius sp. PS-C2]|uniref:GlxA family transcriptional regulator n=1 Tax=Roseovarius sp. PS-C2 TaxID=2820814 RepID=UPI001C0E5AF8|nr:helix-turn-helix domain-containing protein [Roseovarius sp. PS-C2]MBU3260192.1 helix-turn-helix domain-containing protein [Roseovarius sp. PS-C2]